MGQKTSPIGFRTGITLGWKSTWYASKAEYGNFLVADKRIRDYIEKKYNRQMPKGAVSKVEIIRTRNEMKITLYSARPGVVIGPRGAEIDKLKEELDCFAGERKLNINVIEVKEPSLNAQLVAEAICEQIERRVPFRRVMKQQCEQAMEAGARGVKVLCSGRLAGAEIARNETQKLGSIPLQTLDADVDYATATARTTYGAIGIKAWVYRGKFGEAPLESRSRRPRQRGPRGGGRLRSNFTPKPAAVAKAPVAPQAAPVENKPEKSEEK